MKITMQWLARFGIMSALVILSVGSASAQASVGKTILDKLAARIAKLENSCAADIKKYCKDVTPGEGRMVYCMQAHEDKISTKCAYELEETAGNIQATSELLKEGVIACKAEIAGVCGKIQPGEGRVATCLIANKTAASKDCAEAIRKVEALTAQ